MKLKSTCVAMLFAFVFACPTLNAADIGDYQTVSTGNWNDASRWARWDGSDWITPAAPPSSADGVITILTSHTITVGSTEDADQLVVIGTLQVNTSLTINDGTGDDLSVASGGTLGLQGTLAAGAGTPSVAVTGTLTWTGGTLGVATTVNAGGVADIITNNKTLGTTLTNNGTINWPSSQVAFNNGTLSNNNIINATGAVAFNTSAGANSFSNNATGVFNKTTSAGAVTFNIPVNNAGTMNVAMGGLISTTANSAFTNSGTINFNGGTGLTLSGFLAGGNQLSAGTAFTGTGLLTITTATNIDLALALPATVDVTISSGTATVGGSGSLAVNGAFAWTSGTLAVPTTLSAATSGTLSGSNRILASQLTNNGSLTFSAGNLSFNSGTIINNGTFNATGNNILPYIGGTNSFTNTSTGVFTRSTATGTLTVNIPFINEGSLNITDGIISLAGNNASFTNSGAIALSNSTSLRLFGGVIADNALNAGTTLSGTGTITTGTSLNVNHALGIPTGISFVTTGTQTLAGSGSATVDGTIEFGAGTVSIPVTVNPAGAINFTSGSRTFTSSLSNAGTGTWSAGNITLNNSAFSNSGTFTIAGTGDLNITNGSANSFTNTGVFIKAAGSAATTNITSIPAVNSGTIRIEGGTLQKFGVSTVGFNNTGTFDIASGATFAYTVGGVSGLLVLDPGTVLTGAGTFRSISTTQINLPLTTPSTMTFELGIGVSAQTISGTGGSLTIGGILNWDGGTMTIPLTIASGAVLNSGAGKNLQSMLTIDGTANLNDPVSGSIAFNNGSIINNGVINDNYASNRTFTFSGGTNSIINNGLYLKTTASTTTVNSGIAVTNSATGMFGGSGTINFAGAITNNGFISPGAASNTALLATTANAVNNQATTLSVKINDATGAGTGNDKLTLPGSVNIDNAKLVVLDLPAAPFPQSYTVLEVTTGAITGEFATVTMPPEYTITYNATTVVVNKIASTLPVTWGSFNAQANNSRVDLTWSTLQEENTSQFFAQHSTDGLHYTTIATLPAQGSSNTEVFYTVTHNTPDASKTNFYRIAQVDVDGNTRYSGIRFVRFNSGKVVAVIITPNPVSSMMQLNIQADNLKLVLSGPSGTILAVYQFQKGTHQVPVAHLPAGIYQLGVYDRNERIDVQKIIKL